MFSFQNSMKMTWKNPYKDLHLAFEFEIIQTLPVFLNLFKSILSLIQKNTFYENENKKNKKSLKIVETV